MTQTISVTVGGHTVTGDVLEIDIYKEVFTVGRCEITIINEANEWGDDFEPDDAILIIVGVDTVFRGYVDDVKPYNDPTFNNLPLTKIYGRDKAFDLAQLYITKKYKDTEIDDVFDDALSTATAEITYTSQTTGAVISHEFKRGYLIDEFKEMCQKNNYDYYITLDATPKLKLFRTGSTSFYLDGGGARADVDLDLVENSITNNILSIEKGERIGFDIANYVDVYAGTLSDHWTDDNSGDWTGNDANVTIADETSITPKILVLKGQSSIKLTRSDNADALAAHIDLATAGYSQATVDLSKNGEGYWLVRWENAAATPNVVIRPYLEDSSGNRIYFHRAKGGGGKEKGNTEDVTKSKWSKIYWYYGDDQDITLNGASRRSGQWYYDSGDSAFNWDAVQKIGISAGDMTTDDGVDTTADANYVLYLDDLTIPDIEVKAISQHAASQTSYGVRMYSEYRGDILNQVELNNYSTALRILKADPVRTLNLTIQGNTDILYTGQSLDVNAPPYGVNGDTKYRILKLHHHLATKRESSFRAEEFTTELELVQDQISGSTQYIDYGRKQFFNSPSMGYLTYLKNKEDEASKSNIPSTGGKGISWVAGEDIPRGADFPDTAKNGDLFYLTDKVDQNYPGLYRFYNGDWELVGVYNLDAIEDGEEYGNAIHERRHESYMRTQHIKFEGEALDGVDVLTTAAAAVTDGIGYIHMHTGVGGAALALITAPTTSFTFNPSLVEHPIGFKTRVMMSDFNNNDLMDIYMMISDGDTGEAFGYWIPASTGQITRFVTHNGTFTTSIYASYINNIGYTLEAWYDPSTGVRFIVDGHQQYITEGLPNIDNINPCWISLESKENVNKVLIIWYWVSTLDWSDFS